MGKTFKRRSQKEAAAQDIKSIEGQNKEQEKMTCSIALRLKKGETFFGPGISNILQLVEQEGSLQKAALHMGMAYSKAWRITKFAEEKLGYELITRKIGGVGGGGSTLTEKGKTFLNTYLEFEKEVQQNVDKLFEHYFKSFMDNH